MPRGARSASLSAAYLLGIVATELVVFDCGPLHLAHGFYSASLPSLVQWPHALRDSLAGCSACCGLGGTLGAAARPGGGHWRRRPCSRHQACSASAVPSCARLPSWTRSPLAGERRQRSTSRRSAAGTP
ncbi:unnamed protein product [Prorocentrum cordatum]|uniref:Mannosyltransferase n=1 Tax=Prorocentrum cordatum TaxID=2364126 RepID=A0ABN9S1R3_9DINO|nr:unnamed protein product [Polarella glacialis]